MSCLDKKNDRAETAQKINSIIQTGHCDNGQQEKQQKEAIRQYFRYKEKDLVELTEERYGKPTSFVRYTQMHRSHR